MAFTCGHSLVLLPSNNASMITRSSLSSTLRARQSKLGVRIAGSQLFGRDSMLLKLGARRYSAAKLSISRRVNLKTCLAVRGEEESAQIAVQTTVPEAFATQLMDVVAKRVQPYLKLSRFKWSLTGPWLLTLWPFYWGAALAAENGTLPDWRIFTLLAVASVILHAATCTVNDLWDKDFDGKVERSKVRPLVTGEVTPFQGWTFFVAQIFVYVVVLSQLEVFSLSSQFQVQIAIPLILHIIYPLTKRWTYWTPVFLGPAMNWSVLLGWFAVRGSVDLGSPALLVPALIAFGGCFWTIVLDAIYAHQDIQDDRDAGVKSLPQLLGDGSKLWLTGFGTAFVASLGVAGHIRALGWPFYVGVAATATHVGWQIATVDLKNPTDCLAKFLSNRWVGAFVFGGIAGAKLLA